MSHLRHCTHTFHVTPLTGHTRQCPSLDGPGQSLLKLVSSLSMFTEAVEGLPTGLCCCRSCPSTSSMFLRRGSQKSLWNFLPATWRKNDVTVQNSHIEQMEKELFCPLPYLTADWVTISHSVTLIYIAHVTVIIFHIFWLYRIALFIKEIFIW